MKTLAELIKQVESFYNKGRETYAPLLPGQEHAGSVLRALKGESDLYFVGTHARVLVKNINKLPVEVLERFVNAALRPKAKTNTALHELHGVPAKVIRCERQWLIILGEGGSPLYSSWSNQVPDGVQKLFSICTNNSGGAILTMYGQYRESMARKNAIWKEPFNKIQLSNTLSALERLVEETTDESLRERAKRRIKELEDKWGITKARECARKWAEMQKNKQ